MTKSERNIVRNKKIVERYLAGETAQDIADALDLTRPRVSQILQDADVTYRDTKRAPRGDKYAFVGSNITREMKQRLLEESKRTGKSVSRIIEGLLIRHFAKKKKKR